MIINRSFVAFISKLSIITIEWLCFKIMIDYLSEQKTDKKTRFLTFVICVLVSLIPSKYVKSIFYLSMGFMFYKINYKVTLYRSVVITSVFWIVVMLIKTVGLGIIMEGNLMGNNIDIYNYFSSLEIMTFSVVIFIGTSVLYKYFRYYKDINKRYFILIFFPICANILSLGIVLLNKANKLFNTSIMSNFSVFFMGVLMVSSNIFMVFLFRKIARDNQVYIENKIIKDKMDMEYKYYSKMRENQENIKKLYHDMRNHMMCIGSLENKGEAVSEYISELNSEISNCESLFNTGNIILDIILSEKKEICTSKGIDLVAHIEFSKCGFIKMNDVCTIFSNILDNAIEACEKIESDEISKVITMKSSYINQNFFVMKIENTKINKIEINQGKIITDKENKITHGIGIENIKKTVHKYDGELDINYKENKFIMKILIPIQ